MLFKDRIDKFNMETSVSEGKCGCLFKREGKILQQRKSLIVLSIYKLAFIQMSQKHIANSS